MSVKDLGNGLGLLYWVETDGISVITSIANTCDNVALTKRDGTYQAPIGGDIAGIGSVRIDTASNPGGLDTFNITVNLISQMSAPILIVDGDAEATAILARDQINSSVPTSGPNYTAEVVSNIVFLKAPISAGTIINGDAVNAVFTGLSAFTEVKIGGAQDGSGIFDPECGRRYFLNANYDADGCSGGGTALAGDLTNAVEISQWIIMRGFQGSIPESDKVIITDALTPARISNYQTVTVDTEASAATDDLNTIWTRNFAVGDRLLLRGFNSGRVTTFKNGVGNIYLANGRDFITGLPAVQIMLMLQDDPIFGTTWHEINRSGGEVLEVAEARALGLPTAKEGIAIIDGATIAGVGTTTFVAGTDEGLQKIENNFTLTGDRSIVFDTATAIAGDKFTITITSEISLGGNDFTIDSIDLSTIQAISGRLRVEAVYDGTVWVTELLVSMYNTTSPTFQIETASLADEAVSTPKIKDLAVTVDKIDDLAVETSKLGVGAVTEVKIGTAAVTLDKMAIELITEVLTVSVSFEAGELGSYQILLPYKCTIISVHSQVTSLIEATDNGTITFNSTLGTMATVVHSGGEAFGTIQTDTATAPNSAIAVDTTLRVITSKTTAGGKVLLSIKLQRS